ncbi:MAG: SLBB domain-containing protein [candidate division WOR-3 bacterium]
MIDFVVKSRGMRYGVLVSLILFAFLDIGYAQEAPGITGLGGVNIQSLLQPSVSGVPSLVGVESPIISEKYVLMPGDKLLVTVTGKLTFSYQSLITYEGKVTISVPVRPLKQSYETSDQLSLYQDVVDAVTVSGLTLREAQDTLTKVMRRYFKDAEVKLTLIGLRSAIVFVTGEVLNPGAYNASPVERVSQLVARAGGVSPLGSKTKISLIRGGLPYANVDIERFENQGDLNANPFIESGDVIYVPPVEGLVTVRGAVFGRGEYRIRASALTTEKERMSEGVYELKPGERVFDVIRKAGGITPWADLHNCYVERLVLNSGGKRQRIPVDLHRVLFEQDSSQNIELVNADIVVVPPINAFVYVEGEVTKPGPLLYTPNLRAQDYIGQAGGPTENGNLGGVVVVRNGKRISGKTNPLIEQGDIVIVPRYGIKWWQDYVTIIANFGIPTVSLILTIIAMQR